MPSKYDIAANEPAIPHEGWEQEYDNWREQSRRVAAVVEAAVKRRIAGIAVDAAFGYREERDAEEVFHIMLEAEDRAIDALLELEDESDAVS